MECVWVMYRIIESRNQAFPVDKYVVGNFGWKTHTIGSDNFGDNKGPASAPPRVLPDYGSLPLSLALGVLGMPGYVIKGIL